ncbi:MAG: YraN family protein [bacterium]|nr:YraN family protein [bacterium]
MNRRNFGIAGETMAVDYLKNRGYVILERNYRFGKNEVDIICEKMGVVVFVEVKIRSSNEFGTHIEAVNPDKANKIIKVARQYLYSRGLLGRCETRFDIIGISKGSCGQGDKIEHIENAFRENSSH